MLFFYNILYTFFFEENILYTYLILKKCITPISNLFFTIFCTFFLRKYHHPYLLILLGLEQFNLIFSLFINLV